MKKNNIWDDPRTRAAIELAYTALTHKAIAFYTDLRFGQVGYRLKEHGVSTRAVRDGVDDQTRRKVKGIFGTPSAAISPEEIIMGCDIHCHVEVKKNGKWRWHQPLVPNRRYDPKEKIDTWNQPKVKEEGYDNRNYRLFAILADVRNGRGFAGIRTGDQFNPISPQRGLPPDVDPKIRERSDGYHSYSWLTLSEILAYDWEQVNEQQGYLSQEQYRAWDKKSMPNGWCGMVSGRDVTTMTEANYLEHQKEGFGGKRPYILCKWVTTYRDAVGCDWWQDTIPRLQKYAKEFDDVRLTFWFDS